MNETVLITGSGNGLGEAIAKIFAGNNYNVVLHGRNREHIENLLNKISSFNINCNYIIGDLRNDKTLEEINNITREKDVSVFINNAAARCSGLSLENIPEENINDLIYVNLLVPIKLTKMIYPYFQAKRYGTFININSITALEPKKFRSVSSAAKLGLDGFTNVFRKEALEYNVRVIGIFPTRINTKPEFEYGIHPDLVAKAIFDAYKDPLIENIILEGRPKQFRSAHKMNYTIHDLLNSG